MKKGYVGPPSSLAAYHAVIRQVPAAECKGVTMPYTSRNGHMYSFLDAGGTMALALPPDRQAEFIATYDTHVVEQHGRTMKDFVSVPAHLLERTSELRAWLDISYERVAYVRLPTLLQNPIGPPNNVAPAII